MIVSCTPTDFASILHESHGIQRIVSLVTDSSVGPPKTDLSASFSSFCRDRYLTDLGNTSGIVAGDVSIFDTPFPNSDLRVSSVPVLHEERSLSFTCIRRESANAFVPPPAPAQLVLSQLMAKSQSAVCIIDPVQDLVTSYNRKFAELWNLNIDTPLTWHGLPMVSLLNHARGLARSGGDATEFLSQNRLAESTTRVLGMANSDAIEGRFDPVWLDAITPFRVIGRFSRLGLAVAIRKREFIKKFEKLTCRQKEVLRSVAAGHSNADTAAQLGIVVKTVEKHRSMGMARLGTESVPELVRLLDVIES